MVSAYIADLIAGRYQSAWNRLSPASRQRWGSLDAFAGERSTYFHAAGSRFTTSDPDRSASELARWLPADFDGRRDRALVVKVTYPDLAGNNAGYEVYVAAADADGNWRIWPVR